MKGRNWELLISPYHHNWYVYKHLWRTEKKTEQIKEENLTLYHLFRFLSQSSPGDGYPWGFQQFFYPVCPKGYDEKELKNRLPRHLNLVSFRQSYTRVFVLDRGLIFMENSTATVDTPFQYLTTVTKFGLIL